MARPIYIKVPKLFIMKERMKHGERWHIEKLCNWFDWRFDLFGWSITIWIELVDVIHEDKND